MKKILIYLITSLCLSQSALALSVSNTTKATASLISTCKMNALPVNFGDITAQSTSDTTILATGTGTLQVLCSKSVGYSIALNLGLGGSSRIMRGSVSNQTIGYGICSTPNLLADKSNCAAGTTWFNGNVVSGTGTGSQQDISVYGFVYKGFYTPDTYSDTVTATISY